MASATERRFDILKQRAGQDVRQQTQEQQEGMKRQFARLGGIGTGAFVKQQRLAQESGAKRLGEAQQNIEFQRLGELQRQQDIQEARAFQSAEREASQRFAGEQLAKQQEFAKAERMGSQEFGALQAEIQRKFASGERVAAQDFQRGLFDIEQQNTLRKLDLAEKQFGMENTVNFLNARLQIAEGIKKGLFGFDDLSALNQMFGQAVPLQSSAGGTMASSENLAKIRKIKDKYSSGLLVSSGVQDREVRAEAKRLGISEDELRRAGFI